MSQPFRVNATSLRVEFPGHDEGMLAARLDLPAGPIRAMALFAHCFTCSKDIFAARCIAAELARAGIGVLRFDFTGLGSSEGEFANTNFSSNLEDLLMATAFLRSNYEAPSLLIGHSLGGAAVLAVASYIPEVKAVATIGAPADTKHVIHNFAAHEAEIENLGKAQVSLAGRTFTIEKQLLDDLKNFPLTDRVTAMKKPLLVLHAPADKTVGIANASRLFGAAKHPKSFVSLDGADHLLTRAEDAEYAAQVIAGWAGRFLPRAMEPVDAGAEKVRVTETREGRFQHVVQAGKHRLFADEPESYGGLDTGLSPYDFLAAALGACTGMTLRMYADRKGLELGRISVEVSHAKIHARDCATCDEDRKASGERIDHFHRVIRIDGYTPAELEEKLLEIADKCPVHRTLVHTSEVSTELGNNPDQRKKDADSSAGQDSLPQQ